jgi:hypothetical protein
MVNGNYERDGVNLSDVALLDETVSVRDNLYNYVFNIYCSWWPIMTRVWINYSRCTNNKDLQTNSHCILFIVLA